MRAGGQGAQLRQCWRNADEARGRRRDKEGRGGARGGAGRSPRKDSSCAARCPGCTAACSATTPGVACPAPPAPAQVRGRPPHKAAQCHTVQVGCRAAWAWPPSKPQPPVCCACTQAPTHLQQGGPSGTRTAYTTHASLLTVWWVQGLEVHAEGCIHNSTLDTRVTRALRNPLRHHRLRQQGGTHLLFTSFFM